MPRQAPCLKQRCKSNPPTLLCTRTTLRPRRSVLYRQLQNPKFNQQQIVMTQLPIIDLRAPQRAIAQQIADACKAHGFFYVVGHNVDESLALRLEQLSHQFFALPEATKAKYAMALGGPRGAAGFRWVAS